jgi:hypothetical protein
MDATTFLIIALILYLSERRSSQSLALLRLSLELLRERRRADDAVRQLRAAQDNLERRRILAAELQAAFLREVSPAMQRARLDPPAEVAGLLGRLSEEVDDGVRDP